MSPRLTASRHGDQHRVFIGRLAELVDGDAVAFIQRLVQQLRRLLVTTGEADRGAVKFVIRAVR